MEKYETLGRRFIALIIDSILLGIANWMIYFAASFFGGNETLLVIFNAAGNLMYVFYFIILHTLYGQTVGKKAVRVRVVDDSEAPINFGQAVLRSLPQLIPALFLVTMLTPNNIPDQRNEIVSYVIYGSAFAFNIADIVVCLINVQRRSLHDFIAGTIVVRTDV